MGLDNGFIVRNLNRKEIPSFVQLPPIDSRSKDGEVEIAYYRKCWGLRDSFLKILRTPQDSECYAYDVDAEDIPALLRSIFPFFSKEYWDEESRSIWTFKEVFNFTLLQQTINLMWLHSYMSEHPEVTCYFYDSY